MSTKSLTGIVYAIRAFEVWKDLERFDKVNCMRLYQLHRKINTLSQGTNLVALFTKLKKLWNKYDAVIPTPFCTFQKSREYEDHL